MTKKFFSVICVLFLFTGLFASETETGAPAGKNEAGYALLESMVVSFNEMAMKGEGGFKTVFNLLQKQMKELKKAKSQEQIDSLFYKRYHRILEVLMLTIRNPETDPEGILDDFCSS